MREFTYFLVGAILMTCYLGLNEASETSESCQVITYPVDTIEVSGEPEKPFITHVTLTSYNPCPEQCNEDYLHTADNTFIDIDKLKAGHVRYVAVSRDLLWCLPFGSRIHIDGLGEYEVRDLMNERFNHCIDVLQHKDRQNFKRVRVKVKRLA
jgi:3D (Asp-Asp-Asp) domain-containing protein